MKKKLKIAIANLPPFVIIDEDKNRGFEIELWEEIAREIKRNFEYEIHNLKDIINLLVKKKIDVALSGITINEKREQVIDFSHPTFASGLTILLSKNRKKINFQATIKYFMHYGFKLFAKMFIIFLGLIFLFANILWFIERANGTFDFSYMPGIIQSMWVSFNVIIGLITGGAFTLVYNINSWAGKSILVLGHLTSLIILAIFIGEITAFITKKKIKIDIEEAEDLAGKKVATVAGSTSERVLKNLGAIIKTTIKIEEAYKKLKNNEVDAVVFDSPILIYYTLNEGSDWAKITGKSFDKQTQGIALQQASPLREEINNAFLKIKESGRYDLLYKKWFGENLSMKV